MQMKIGGMGFGVGIPKSSLQVGALNIIKLYFRRSASDKNIKRLGIQDLVSVGGKSGTFIFSSFVTDWFELDPKTSGWASNTNLLIGKSVEVKIDGVVVKWGSVDLSFKLFDKYNQSKTLVDQCCVKVLGGIKFSDLKVRGRITRSEV